MAEFCIGVYREDLTDENVLRKLRSAGLRQLSVSCELLMREGTDRAACAEIREKLDKYGLSAVTSHPPFGSYNEPFSVLRQHPAALREELEWMREFIARCGLLGVRAIPLHTGGAMLPRAREWERECARRYVEALLPAAEKSGVIIAIENTNHATPVGLYPDMTENVKLNKNIWEFDDTDRIIELVRHFDSPLVRICYDTGHSHLLGKMLRDLRAFLPYTALFHIHDNDGAGNDAHIQPGYGNSPWAAFFEAVRGCRAPMYVEARPYWNDTALMLTELNAIAENRVTVKRGGFLKKDPDTGRIVILSEPAAPE